MLKKTVLLLIAVVMFVCVSCVSVPTATVERVDSNTDTDLSGYWNDTDVKIVCNTLIAECLESPRVAKLLNDIQNQTGELPVAIVGMFKNDSDEHLDTGIISQKMEMALTNSGKVDFIATGDARDEIREERKGQQLWASEDTAKELADETGADIMLQGSLKSMVDRADGKMVRNYIVRAELINIQTGKKLWIGQNDSIKKIITRDAVRF